MPKHYLSTIIFIIIAFIIVVAITLIASSGSAPTTPMTQQATPAPVASTTVAQGYTMAQVAQHAVKTDCWTTINGSVYNVTSWISDHPGGAQAIIGLCGIDGSEAFNGQHGGERRPASELAGFKIGILAR